MSARQDEQDAAPSVAEATTPAPRPSAGEPPAEAEAEPGTGEAEPEATEAEPEAAATTAAEPEATESESEATESEPEAAGEATEPDDPWTRFGPAGEPVPTRAGRIRRAAARVLLHEWTIAALGSIAVAIVMTWPTLRHPTRTLPQDLGDPTLQAWQVAWAGHILRTDPSRLWHGNAFFPDSYSYAFSDSLLGYAPFGLIGSGPVAAVLRYNILFVLAFALATFGAYALVRQLGAGRIGAAVAAVAFAYAPWRLAQAGHLHVMSSGGIVLALAMLARGHGWSLKHGYRPDRRHAGWAVAGWLVAAWQLTLGFGIGLPFAYALMLIVLAAAVGYGVTWAARRQRPPFGWRLLTADAVGGVVFAAAGLLMAQPYLKVVELHPYAKRLPEEIALYSSPLRGFLTAPPESWLWGTRHVEARASLEWAPEMTLLPGFVLLGLAAAGLVFSIWRVWIRLALAAGVVITVALGMGTRVADGGRPGYMTLYDHLYAWDAIRTPGRLVLWTTLLLGILAAGAVGAFVDRAGDATADRVPDRPGPWLRLATLLPVLLILVEGLSKAPHPEMPPAPAALRTAPSPILVLPSDPIGDMQVMLWSTDGFPKIVNGNSGFYPRTLTETREIVKTFPDQPSVERLRQLGVRTVVLLRQRVPGTAWANAADQSVDGLDITREEVGDTVVFHLS